MPRRAFRPVAGFPLIVCLCVAGALLPACLAAQTGAAPGGTAVLAADAAHGAPLSDVPGGNADQPATTEPKANESGVRIVRLSEVSGSVELDRGTGLDTAFQNLPVVQGSRLQTHAGLAEVEFEDNSSLRLTPNTEVDFPHLALSPGGVLTSEVRVITGTVYASLSEKKSNPVTILFGKNSVALPPGSHVELTVSEGDAYLRVLSGSLQVTYPGGTVNVGKKKMLTLGAGAQAGPEIAEIKGDAGTYDAWDKRSTDYHKVRASAFNSGASNFAYGSSDLAYYGSFVDLGGGCGSLWQPYFVGAGWSPYANGSWAWYQGAGYSWVSPYPWGWTPFHSGFWQNCGAGGWGWNPTGGGWYGLRNVPLVRGASIVPGGGRPLPGAPQPGSFGPPTPRPPQPGGVHHPATVPVNSRPLQVSSFSRESGDFVFRNGSAGLGVPRSGLGNLREINSLAIQHGAVAQSVAAPAPMHGVPASAMAGSRAVVNSPAEAGVAGRGGAMYAHPATAAGVYHMPSPSSASRSDSGGGRSTASSPSSPSTPSAPRSMSSGGAPSAGGAAPRSH